MGQRGADDSGDGAREDERPSESDELLREFARVPKAVAPDPGAPPGTRLGQFRIVEKIGEGGMGIVYRAEDEKLRRHVALKVLPESFAKDDERRRRFLREARSAAAITHANIATVYDVGEVDGRTFIAMELVEGDTLRARIHRGLSVPDALRIAREIARGLGRAHEKGVVHRDLKPENVMITRHDDVKILDFGLAKLRESTAPNASAVGYETTNDLTGEGKLLGTPAYMSPEQARGLEVDARTDVFSFGVVLYEMVAGDRPFVGQTTQDVITSVLRDNPARPSFHNPLVPPEIERVIDRCLEKEREARYADGQELVRALSADPAEARVSEPSSARRPGAAPTVSLITPGPSTNRSNGKRRRRWELAVLGGLGAVGLGWVYLTRGATPTVDALSRASAGVDTAAPFVSSGSAPAAMPIADILPAPIPFPPPEPAVEQPSARGVAAPIGSAKSRVLAAEVTSNAPRQGPPRVAPSVSAAAASSHAPPHRRSQDELFDTQK